MKPASIGPRPDVVMHATLPTLGGTAVEAITPIPPVPAGAWIILGLGLGALVLAARRGGENSPAPRAPGGFRSQPSCEGSVERMVA